MIKWGCWVLLLFFLLSCNTSVGENKVPTPTPTPLAHTRVSKNTYNFPWQERWRLSIRLINEYQNVRNLIAVQKGVILMDGAWLKFISADQGELQWAIEIEGWVDSIIADQSLVYITGRAGRILEARELQTGNLIWESTVNLPDHTAYYLRLQDQKLYAYDLWSLVYVFDRESGELIADLHAPSTASKPFSLLFLGNKDWLQAEDQQVMLIQDEQLIWQTSLEGLPQKFPQIYNNIIVIRFKDDKTVFGSLVGLDITNGNLIWQRKAEFYSNFILREDLLYVITKDADIELLDPKTGQTVGFADLQPNNVDTFHPISGIAADEDMLYIYFADSQELITFERVRD